jgi:hypothetical protein
LFTAVNNGQNGHTEVPAKWSAHRFTARPRVGPDAPAWCRTVHSVRSSPHERVKQTERVP